MPKTNNLIKKTLLIFGLIGIVLRFISLNAVPPHLSNDEISIAYDSYSVSRTGKDEYGNYLPLSFRSYDTYKAPLYAYISSLFHLVLPNQAQTVRLPSAILGTLTTVALGLLVYELTKNKQLAFLSAILLAVNPAHITTSRMALETNISLFFLTLGLYLIFKALKNKKIIYYLVSALSLSLSLYAYHTEWGLTPLLILGLILVFPKITSKNKKFWLFGILFTLLILPLGINYWQNRDTNARANTELILKDPFVDQALNNPEFGCLKKGQIIFIAFFNNYSAYLNPAYLFFNGLNLLDKHDPFQVGLFLMPLLPFLILGFYKLKKYFSKHSIYIYLWLLFTPIIPALTRGGQSLWRILPIVVILNIFIAVGLYWFYGQFKKKKKLVFTALGLIFFSFIYFSAIYFYHFPKENGVNFQYGFKQIAEYSKDNYQQFDQFIVDYHFGDIGQYYGVPHLYIPYHTSMNPQKVLNRDQKDKALYFDKYVVKEINWGNTKITPKTYYAVGVHNLPPEKIKQKLSLVKSIPLPNGETAFKIYKASNE